MVPVFAHHHVSTKPRSGQPLLNRLHGLLSGHHRAPFFARVLRTDLLDHIERRRDELQPLTHFLANGLQLALALRAATLALRKIVHHPLPRQMLRESLPPVRRDFRFWLWRFGQSFSD